MVTPEKQNKIAQLIKATPTISRRCLVSQVQVLHILKIPWTQNLTSMKIHTMQDENKATAYDHQKREKLNIYASF